MSAKIPYTSLIPGRLYKMVHSRDFQTFIDSNPWDLHTHVLNVDSDVVVLFLDKKLDTRKHHEQKIWIKVLYGDFVGWVLQGLQDMLSPYQEVNWYSVEEEEGT